jgi:hypothetical protein
MSVSCIQGFRLQRVSDSFTLSSVSMFILHPVFSDFPQRGFGKHNPFNISILSPKQTPCTISSWVKQGAADSFYTNTVPFYAKKKLQSQSSKQQQ